MAKTPDPTFRVQFVSQDKVFEVFAKQIYSSDLYGFIEVEEFVFGERSGLLVDPSEEKLKAEFQGVIPDIQFPSAFDPTEIGESALDTALPWDQIRSLRYRPIDTPQAHLAQLIDLHQARIATDPDFKALLKRTERALELSGETGISLHLETRIQEREANNQALLDIENMRRGSLGLETAQSISELEAADKEDDVSSDASLMESARILLDEIQLNRRLAGL